MLAPSQEAYDCTIAHGVHPARVRRVGFPVRSRFMNIAPAAPKPAGQPLTITIMSGSEGSGTVRAVARELLAGTDAQVNVICGRNKALRKKLRNALGKRYHGRLNAMGFVDDIQLVMRDSDLLVMRASPNSVMEAVALNKPVILFGQLAGQELHNPQMLAAHGLAEYCPVPAQLPACVARLTANGGEGIERNARQPARLCARRCRRRHRQTAQRLHSRLGCAGLKPLRAPAPGKGKRRGPDAGKTSRLAAR